MIDKVNDCPNCSGNKLKSGYTKYGHYIECTECKTCGPISDTLEGAMGRWNEMQPYLPNVNLTALYKLLQLALKKINAIEKKLEKDNG